MEKMNWFFENYVPFEWKNCIELESNWNSIQFNWLKKIWMEFEFHWIEFIFDWIWIHIWSFNSNSIEKKWNANWYIRYGKSLCDCGIGKTKSENTKIQKKKTPFHFSSLERLG
jgi:hypothetical protein